MMAPTNPDSTFNTTPMLWLAIAFAIGIVTANVVQLPILLTTIVSALIAVAAILMRQQIAGTVLILFLLLLGGAVDHSSEKADVREDRIKVLLEKGTLVSRDPVEIEGSLANVPEPAPEGYFLLIDARQLTYKAADISTSGRVRLFLPISNDDSKVEFSDLKLRYRSRVRITVRLEREASYQNPGVMSRLDILDRQGIDATVTIKSPLLIESLGRDPAFIPLAFAYESRVKLIEDFRASFSSETAGVLIASLLGNKYFLDKRTADIFREGGTFHVLVISGLHITFIGGLLLLFVRLFTASRRLQVGLVLAILWLYGMSVGGETPVIRACVMFTILMVGYATYRQGSLLNLLGTCALLILAWRPSDLFDPSFQLTFVSVAAIVAFGLPVLERLKSIGSWTPSSNHPFPPNVADWLRRSCETIYWREAKWTIEQRRHIWSSKIFKSPYTVKIDDLGLRRVLIFVFEAVVISASVQIWLLPLSVVYFHRVSLISIPMNLWVSGVIAAESLAATLAVFIVWFSHVIATPFVTVTEVLNWMLINAPSVLTDASWASSRLPIYSGIGKLIYLIYFLPVIALSLIVARWDAFSLKKKVSSGVALSAVIALISLASIVILHPFSAARPDGRLTVEFLDVGQGDSAFITFPNGETMLIDAGGRMNYKSDDEGDRPFEPDVPRIGEMVVSEFLWEKGISRIDHIVATHADADHIQGLVDVTNNFAVGRAFFGNLNGDDPDLKALLSNLDRFGVPKTIVTAGDAFEIGGVRVDVMNPFENVATQAANNGSIVLKLTFGETAFLFTGDIERDAEAAILSAGEDLASTVVKVPHHGSRSSSTQPFVDSAKANYAIISVGRNSVFGHPHAEVVERWKAAGANVMTTGENGTISISTNGTTIDLRTFLYKQ